MREKENNDDLNREILPMRKKCKVSFLFWLNMLVGSVNLGLVDLKLVKENHFSEIIMVVNIILLIVFGGIIIRNNIKFEDEKDDELSKDNKIKTNSVILSIFITVGACFYLYSQFGKAFSFTVTNENFHYFWMLLFFSYYTLQNGIFLLLDKSDKDVCGED